MNDEFEYCEDNLNRKGCPKHDTHKPEEPFSWPRAIVQMLGGSVFLYTVIIAARLWDISSGGYVAPIAFLDWPLYVAKYFHLLQ